MTTSPFTLILVLCAVLLAALQTDNFAQNTNPACSPATAYRKKDSKRVIVETLCDVVASALHIAGLQGGYGLEQPTEAIELGPAKVPFYYNQGKLLMPQLADIEGHLAKFIEEKTLTALAKKLNILREESRITTTVKIRQSQVDIHYDIALRLRRSDGPVTMTLRMTTPTIPLKSRFKEMYEIAQFITESHKEDPEYIAISTVADMARERHLRVEFLRVKDREGCTLVKISLNKALPENKDIGGPIIFCFLNQYPTKKRED